MESLLDHAVDVLEDWDAYAAHPEVIYVISRIVIFGSLTADSNSTPLLTLQRFVKHQTFETLWEVITLDHLWKIEISAEACTFQELQHRGIVARTILAACRQAAAALQLLTDSITNNVDSHNPSLGSPAGAWDPRVVLERFIVLCLYNAFEKESCSIGGVHDAASSTVRALSELGGRRGTCTDGSSIAQDPLEFFFQYCKTVADEARRAVLDPELHGGAIKVISGLTRYVARLVEQSRFASTPRASIVIQHLTPLAGFVQDTIEMLVASIKEWKQRQRSSTAPIVGCMNVLQHAVTLVVALTASSPRAYPSEEDWDDARRWTSTDPRIMALQELTWTTVFQQLHPMCLIPNTAIASRAVSITMTMLDLFRTPAVDMAPTSEVQPTPPTPNTESQQTSTAMGTSKCGIVRTHLNTLHRIYHAWEDLLVCSWKDRKEDAVGILDAAQTLAAAPHVVDDATLAPGSKRTKRSTLLRNGRWLAELPIPVELSEVIAALSALTVMAPAFLAPRMVEEASPAVLLWYTRCYWMVHVPTRREDSGRLACVAFLKNTAEMARTAGLAESSELLLARCRGTVLAAHWPELYDAAA